MSKKRNDLKEEVEQFKSKLQKLEMQPSSIFNEYVFLDSQEIINLKKVLSESLIGKKVYEICKRLGIFIISFGEKLEYSLHIECFFRIRKGNRLVLTYNDEYYAPNWTELTRKNFKRSQKNCCKNSLLEKTFNNFKYLTQEAVVSSIEISEVGDLFISFNNGVLIEIFLDCVGQNNEFYRFFKYDDTCFPHYVVKCLEGKIILEK